MTNQINGWTLYRFRLFADQYRSLLKEVRQLAQEKPDSYKAHPKTKLLASMQNSIDARVPENPDSKEFRQGKTLGKGNSHWRRVKNGMPNRYRLFFRFNSTPPIIIYVWMNDERTLRKAGSKTDCYNVFKKMLSRGEVPDNIKQLIDSSQV